MLRLVLLSLSVALVSVSAAQAHGVHADCRVGDSRLGVAPHYHPGAYGPAQPCGGGGGGYRSGNPGYGDHPGYGGGGYYQPHPRPTPPGYGGGPHRAGDGYRNPQGAILGHGEAVGCAPSFSRVVQGGGSVCREIP